MKGIYFIDQWLVSLFMTCFVLNTIWKPSEEASQELPSAQPVSICLWMQPETLEQKSPCMAVSEFLGVHRDEPVLCLYFHYLSWHLICFLIVEALTVSTQAYFPLFLPTRSIVLYLYSLHVGKESQKCLIRVLMDNEAAKNLTSRE